MPEWWDQAYTDDGIDPGLNGTVASKKDSRPQTILKFYCPKSLAYRAHHEFPVNSTTVIRISQFWALYCKKGLYHNIHY